MLEEGTTITPAAAGTGEEEEEEEEEEENMNHSMNNSMNNSLLDNSMNNSLLDHSSMSDGTLQFEGEKTSLSNPFDNHLANLALFTAAAHVCLTKCSICFNLTPCS